MRETRSRSRVLCTAAKQGGRRAIRLAQVAITTLLIGLPAGAQDLPGSVILATGDEVPGFGRIGTYGFSALGVDDRGRVLISTEGDSTRLFWADGERFESALECGADCPEYFLVRDLSFAGPFAATGYTLQPEASGAVYSVVSAVLTRVAAVGDQDADGNTLCDIDAVHINDRGTVGFVAPIVPPGVSCDALWNEEITAESGVYLSSGGLRRVFGTGALAPPGVESGGVRLVAVLNDESVVVSSSYATSTEVLLVDDGGVKGRLVGSGDLGSTGFPLFELRSLAGNRAGEVLVLAREGGGLGLYRTERGAVRRILAEGDAAPWGGILRFREIEPDWLSFNDEGDVLVGVDRRAALLPANGTGARVVAEPVVLGYANNRGDFVVTDSPVDGSYRARRLHGGEARTLVQTGDVLPDGEILAEAGIGASCLGADGTVGVVVQAVGGEQAFVCGDSRGFRVVSRVGDPTPEGFPIVSFDQCAFDGRGTLLLGLATRLPSYEGQEFELRDRGIYRATVDGIERLIGPGDRTADGAIVRYLSDFTDDPFGSRAFASNAAGRILASASIRPSGYSQQAFVVLREDGVLERLPPPFDDRRNSFPKRVLLSDSGSVIALVSECRGSSCSSAYDRDTSIVEWTGEEIHRIASARDLAAADALHPEIGSLFVAGRRIAFEGSYLGGSSRRRIFTYAIGDKAPAEVIRSGDDSPLGPLADPYVVGLTEAGKLYLTDYLPESRLYAIFSWENGGIEVLGQSPFFSLPTLKAAGADTLLLAGTEALRLVGSPTGTSCPAPPTAIVPTPTVTVTPRPTPTALPPYDPVPVSTCGEFGPCLRVGGAVAAAGESVRVQVSLDTRGPLVADVRSGLLMPPVVGEPECEFDPAIDKVDRSFSLEGPVLWSNIASAEDISPIPDGSLLYACTLTVAAGSPAGVYPIRCLECRAFTPRGDGPFCGCADGVLIVEAPTLTPTPTETAPPSPSSTATVLMSATPSPTARKRMDDGCQIDAESERPSALPILAAGLLLICLRRSARSRRTVNAAGIVAVSLLVLARSASADCFGDCNDDGRVGIDELLDQVAASLESRSVEDCADAEPNPYDALSLDELIMIVGNALEGCPRAPRFAAVQYIPVGSVGDVAVADLDGDQIPDLVTADYDADEVWWFAGRGDGTFDAGRGISLGPRTDGECGPWPGWMHPGPMVVQVMDVDGDGASDIVTANSCVYDSGNFAFVSAAALEIGAGRVPRFVVAEQPQNYHGELTERVSVLYGNGDGEFSVAWDYPAMPLLEYTDVKVADFDRDRAPDMVAAQRLTTSVALYFGTLAGDFPSPRYVDISFNWLPRRLEIDDLDRDGWPDFVLLSSDTVSFFYNTHRHSFQMRYWAVVSSSASAMAVVDMNRDGSSDVLVTSQSEHEVRLLLTKRSGAVAAWQRIGPTGSGPWEVRAADLNGDGWPDFVTADAHYRSVSVFLQQADAAEPLFTQPGRP